MPDSSSLICSPFAVANDPTYADPERVELVIIAVLLDVEVADPNEVIRQHQHHQNRHNTIKATASARQSAPIINVLVNVSDASAMSA